MDSKKKVIVFASGSGTHLQNFIDAQGDCGFEIQLIITNNPKAFAIERAKLAGIELAIIPHTEFESRASFEKAVLARVKQKPHDIILLAGFMRVLSPYFFSQIKTPILNIHPSLLPKYKGLNTHDQVLQSQDRFHGASVHLVNEQLDSGALIKQVKIPIAPDDTAITLQDRLLPFEHRIYLEVLIWFCLGRLTFNNHQVFLDDKPLDYPIIDIED